jgi:hypothetical protein
LCRSCHIQVHQNIINIKGYITTGNGVILDYVKNETSTASIESSKSIIKSSCKRKLDTEQIKIVKMILSENSNKSKTNHLNKKSIITELNTTYGITIDYKILSKIENNNY